MKITVEDLVKMAEERMYKDYYIHAGTNRNVSVKQWENGDKKRNYITIQCYTLAGNYKGAYKCGYVDMVSGEYVFTNHDDIDLTTTYKPSYDAKPINPLENLVE